MKCRGSSSTSQARGNVSADASPPRSRRGIWVGSLVPNRSLGLSLSPRRQTNRVVRSTGVEFDKLVPRSVLYSLPSIYKVRRVNLPTVPSSLRRIDATLLPCRTTSRNQSFVPRALSSRLNNTHERATRFTAHLGLSAQRLTEVPNLPDSRHLALNDVRVRYRVMRRIHTYVHVYEHLLVVRRARNRAAAAAFSAQV